MRPTAEGVYAAPMADTPDNTPAQVIGDLVDAAHALAGDQGDGGQLDQNEFSLLLGTPAAFISGPDRDDDEESALLGRDNLVEREANPAQAIQGSVATVHCACGQRFIMDLLKDNVKTCPGCKQRYTHLLVVCPVEDDEIFGHVLEYIQGMNEGETPNLGAADATEVIPDAD